MSPSYAELAQRNNLYAKTHSRLPTIADFQAAGTEAPKTCILTCIDPRVFVEKLFNLKIGEAFIYRTIAGRPQAIIQEIICIDRVSKGFEDFILLYHTDCGSTLFTQDQVRSEVLKACPSASASVGGIDFGAVDTSIEQRLREDIEWLKKHPMMPLSLVKAMRGVMYDLETGRLRQIA